VLDQDAVRWRAPGAGEALPEETTKSYRKDRSTGLKGFWRYMTTVRPRNRWVPLWRSSLPCAGGCPAPIDGLSYLELDADLSVRGAPETYTCQTCGRRFVLVAVTSH
jgi:hypothetical protein